jgi:hypothetical protein
MTLQPKIDNGKDGVGLKSNAIQLKCTFLPFMSMSVTSSVNAFIVAMHSIAGYSHNLTQPSAPAVAIFEPLWLNRTRF